MRSGLTNLLHLGRDAMSVNAKALDVTGQNVANVNTPGYARRRAELQARGYSQDSYGGVTVGSLSRAADELTQRRLFDVQGQAAGARERSDSLAPVEAAFNDANGTGLAAGLSRFFDAFNTLASKPSDQTARAGVLSAAQTVVDGFQMASTSIDGARADMLAKAQGYTKQVNHLAQGIASLNGSVQSALAAGHDAADLLDRRDQLVRELSGLVDVKLGTNPDGTFLVRAGGQSLVEGNSASTFSVTVDAQTNLVFESALGTAPSVAFNGAALGGKLGGLREARDIDLVATRANLDTLAADLATAVNGLHAAGTGLDGVGGRNLFAFNAASGARSLAVDAAVLGQPSRVAASSTAAPGGNDVALRLAALTDAKVTAGGTKSLVESYADLVGDLGLRRQKATSDEEVKRALADQMSALHEETVGVSLDEEMVNLTRYQRSYEASSKLLKTFDELMQTLISLK